jgi:hypothetical protein
MKILNRCPENVIEMLTPVSVTSVCEAQLRDMTRKSSFYVQLHDLCDMLLLCSNHWLTCHDTDKWLFVFVHLLNWYVYSYSYLWKKNTVAIN